MRMKKAEITVFLALLLSVILSLIMALYKNAGIGAMELNAGLSMDEALNSCFSEYSRELFRRYDLLFIDTSYREGEGDISRLEEHLGAYLSENIGEKGGSDLFGLSLGEVKIERYLLGSDEEGGVMMDQAVAYMNRYGEMRYRSGIEEAMGEISFQNDSGVGFFREWDDCLAEVFEGEDVYLLPRRIREQSADSFPLLLHGTAGILYRLNYTDVPSRRRINAGSCPANLYNVAEDLPVFSEYLMQKLGCYTEPVGEQALSCELEYLLFGEDSDKENLIRVTDRLMSEREEMNLRLIMNSPDMYGEAEELSERLIPESEGRDRSVCVKALIYAWAWAESFIEVNRLLCGGRCGFRASRSGFILPLEELESFSDYLGSGGGNGLTYKEYLGIMLNEGSLRDSKRRFMDIVEMDMKKLENGNFVIDGLVGYIEAKGRFLSRQGYERIMRRTYAY